MSARWSCALAVVFGLHGTAAVAGDHRFVMLDGPRDPVGTDADHVVPKDLTGVPWPANVVTGAAQLQMSRDFVGHVAAGLDLLYQRRYRDTRTYFAELEEVFPGTAVSAVADLLVWQAMMLENFDFRYDDQYRASSALARTKLADAMKTPGNDTWEHLMLGVVSGIEGIHAARRGRYLPALTLAFEAIDQMEATRALAPTFVDIHLADGLYNYWRSAITDKLKGLPDFGDHRTEGIAQMEEVIRDGVFLGPPARLSMAFTWMEQDDFDKAHAELAANHARYPQNVINELMLGMTDVYRKQYGDALATFDHVQQLDPKNRRVLYYRALALQRSDRDAEAKAAYTTYLQGGYLEPYQEAGAHYHLGQIAEGAKAWPEAYEHYKEAVRVDGHSGARSAIDRLKGLKREGKAEF